MTPPIFFGITRSFWLTVGTCALILEQGEPAIRALAQAFVLLSGTGDVDAVMAWVQTIAPVITTLLALQQRAGAARPYTIRLTRETRK